MVQAVLTSWSTGSGCDRAWFSSESSEHLCIFGLDGAIIIIITKAVFMMLSSWQSHCKSSPSSFDECRMAPSGRRPKTKPDDLGCESACTGCQNLHLPSPFILLLLSLKADTHFTVQQRVEGWVDLAGWLHTEMVYPSIDCHPSWY